MTLKHTTYSMFLEKVANECLKRKMPFICVILQESEFCIYESYCKRLSKTIKQKIDRFNKNGEYKFNFHINTLTPIFMEKKKKLSQGRERYQWLMSLVEYWEKREKKND